jgi:LysR family hca operon transcriptional activator
MDLRHHTAQPSLSRQLRELELEFDARLLESRARCVIPTRAERLFLSMQGRF